MPIPPGGLGFIVGSVKKCFNLIQFYLIFIATNGQKVMAALMLKKELAVCRSITCHYLTTLFLNKIWGNFDAPKKITDH